MISLNDFTAWMKDFHSAFFIREVSKDTIMSYYKVLMNCSYQQLKTAADHLDQSTFPTAYKIKQLVNETSRLDDTFTKYDEDCVRCHGSGWCTILETYEMVAVRDERGNITKRFQRLIKTEPFIVGMDWDPKTQWKKAVRCMCGQVVFNNHACVQSVKA